MLAMKVAVLVFVLGMATLPSVLNAQQWKGGAHITFYGAANGAGTQAGACGYQNTYKLGYGSMTAALSTVLYQGGAACGACYQIRCAPNTRRGGRNWCYNYGRSITVTATNLCPPGSTGGWCNPPSPHFDLPYPAFATLARREGGVAPVYYRRSVMSPCRVSFAVSECYEISDIVSFMWCAFTDGFGIGILQGALCEAWRYSVHDWRESLVLDGAHPQCRWRR